MRLSATQLRSDLYRILDQVAETGEPVEVERVAGTIVLSLAAPARKSRRRKKARGNPRLVVGDPDELVHFDWSKAWNPFL